MKKVKSLLNKSNKSTYLFDGEKISYFVLLDSKLETNRIQASNCFKTLTQLKIDSIAIVSEEKADLNYSFLEGLLLSTYTFNKYKKEAKEFVLNIDVLEKVLSKDELNTLQINVEANSIAKDLVNEPQSYLNAVQYAADIKALGKDAGFDVTIFDKKKIEKLKMGGILAVNKGSIQEPTFVIMEHKPAKALNKKPIVLVGKGVTYDTGGLSLKPTANSMDFMKSDMGGSATVVGTMYGAAKMNLPVHVIGLVSLTDNRPGLDAVAPGDVITMYSGDSVEVLNTDAEGRLVLADALHYAKKYKPEFVFDFATLTGASAAAIGPQGTVCMGNEMNEKTKEKLFKSGIKTHERLVEFPMWDEYGELLKSEIADYKNLGGPYGGSITAGKFLQVFTDYPWMHFDIAGPAYLKAPVNYKQYGGTGVGVRLMLDFLSNY
ncbi:MAG: leucyl aminopeptidase family protein [Chitinophagales bacterium]